MGHNIAGMPEITFEEIVDNSRSSMPDMSRSIWGDPTDIHSDSARLPWHEFDGLTRQRIVNPHYWFPPLHKRTYRVSKKAAGTMSCCPSKMREVCLTFPVLSSLAGAQETR